MLTGYLLEFSGSLEVVEGIWTKGHDPLGGHDGDLLELFLISEILLLLTELVALVTVVTVATVAHGAQQRSPL